VRLGVVRRIVAHVVVAAGNVQRHEHDVRLRPSPVLRIAFLHGGLDAAEPERGGGTEKNLAQMREALDGIGERRPPVAAVGPLVVARRVDERMPRCLELGLAARVERVGAGRAAALDVAHVDHERQRLAVHAREHPHEGLLLAIAVRRVAHHAEHEGLGRTRRRPARAHEESARGERAAASHPRAL
jgi:hypothetical protein